MCGLSRTGALKHVRFGDRGRDEAKWSRRLIKLLRAEQAVSQRLDHPNIIRIFDASVDTEQAYVVMEYFAGGSLERYCGFQNLLPIHRTIGIIFKCCMALDHAYRQGIVHRDIKPANILVDEHDNVRSPTSVSRSTSRRSSTPTRPSSWAWVRPPT